MNRIIDISVVPKHLRSRALEYRGMYRDQHLTAFYDSLEPGYRFTWETLRLYTMVRELIYRNPPANPILSK
jgi:hypothetical protein